MGETIFEMELSQAVLDGLALAGDAAHVPDKSYSVLITRALDGLLDERHRHLVASKQEGKSNSWFSQAKYPGP